MNKNDFKFGVLLIFFFVFLISALFGLEYTQQNVLFAIGAGAIGIGIIGAMIYQVLKE
jgi:hypothetical protein